MLVSHQQGKRAGRGRQRARDPHLLQNVDVVRDVERVARVLVREEVVEDVPPAPGDAAQAQRARLVRAEKDRVACLGPLVSRDLVELLDRLDLAVLCAGAPKKGKYGRQTGGRGGRARRRRRDE